MRFLKYIFLLIVFLYSHQSFAVEIIACYQYGGTWYSEPPSTGEGYIDFDSQEYESEADGVCGGGIDNPYFKSRGFTYRRTSNDGRLGRIFVFYDSQTCTDIKREQAYNQVCDIPNLATDDGHTSCSTQMTHEEPIDPRGEYVNEITQVSFACVEGCRVTGNYDSVVASASYYYYERFDVTRYSVFGEDCDDMPENIEIINSTFLEGAEPFLENDLPDTDDDNIPDVDDPDIDNDGIPNEEDPDIDNDGIKDKPDNDNDNIPDHLDDDIDNDGIKNNQDDDRDGDGTLNVNDPTPDGDLISGDNVIGPGGGGQGGNSSSTASNCDSLPQSQGDAQLAGIHKQLWINECEGKEKKISGVGDCESAFECEGDPIVCAIAEMEYNKACALKPDKLKADMSAQFEAEGLTKTEIPADEELYLELDADSIVGDFLNADSASGSCPPNIVLDLLGNSITVDLSPLCEIGSFVRFFVILAASFAGLMMFYRAFIGN